MITTDTGAKKWENSDNWRQIYQAHNDSVDAEDAAIAALQDGIAIVANGNTHAAIASGQFVFVKNHDTLAAGLYTANSAIAANATLTSSNLTADPSGGFNALNSNLAKIDSNTVVFWSTLSTQKYQGRYFAQVYGNFKGKTLTLTGANVYNGTSSYDILSTTEITKLNDFCVNITTTSDSVGGTPLYVSFSVS